MKNWIYITLFALFLSVAACTEDDITLDSEVSALPYELSQGEEGSLEELIYTFHERYGSYVIYDVDEIELNWTWEDRLYYEMVPVDAEAYRNCIVELISFLMDDVFAVYPDEFIADLLPRRVYLVDTLMENDELFSTAYLVNHSLVIGRVGAEMAAFTDSDWEELNVEVTGQLLGNVEVPQEFYDLIVEDGLILGMMGVYETDPEGEYDSYHYALYTHGFLGSGMRDDYYGMFYVPEEIDDLVDYLTFLMSSPATEIENVCGRFEVVKSRARIVVQTFLDEQGLDLIAIQNGNCPDDPLASDYFNE